MDNDGVLERCEGFLMSMREISAPEHIAYQVTTQTPLTQPLLSLSDRVARGDVRTAPVTLTLGAGRTPSFEVRGTHAYGMLATRSASTLGPVVLVVATAVLALIAVLLFRAV